MEKIMKNMLKKIFNDAIVIDGKDIYVSDLSSFNLKTF